MDKIVKYSDYVNEGVLDELKPKSDEDIKETIERRFKGKTPREKLFMISHYDLGEYLGNEYIQKIIDEVDDYLKVKFGNFIRMHHEGEKTLMLIINLDNYKMTIIPMHETRVAVKILTKLI